MKKELFLVDVSAMFFRAYYAIPNLTNKEGFPTNALYGFLGMTSKLLLQYKPSHIVYCFDRPEPSFRKDLDERYKANRGEMPEDLGKQIPYIKEFTDLLGIPRLDIKGYEADDIIGAYAKWGEKNNFEVTIVSGDKDFAQLISEKVKMLDTMKDITYDIEGVVKKWGVHPEKFRDYLALIGDSSDNIPGVKGVGPKTAQKLIEDYGSLEEIYNNVDSIKGSLKAKLIENRDEAILSQTLVTIKTDIEIPTDDANLTLKPKDFEKLHDLFIKFNFNKFAKELGEESLQSDTNTQNIEVNKVSKEKSGSASIVNMAPQPKKNKTEYKIFDSATEKDLDLIPEKSEIYFIETSDGEGGFIHYKDTVLCFKDWNDDLKKKLVSKNFIWSGFDLKSIWKELGIEATSFKDDLMLAAYALKAGAIDFDSVHTEYLDPIVPDETQPGDLVSAHLKLLEKIKNEMAPKILEIYENIEKPCLTILSKMENIGVKIDTDILAEQSKDLSIEIKGLEQQIYDLAGEEFNINSPKQLGKILFEKLELPTAKKTKTGFSTATGVLEKLTEYPIAEFVLNYRELAKLKSTYVDALPKLVNKVDGRIHTTFRQALTATGRLSSVNPNLQNIPIRSEKGLQIRKAFIPTPGWDLIAADYSQIELRILAHIAGDSALIKAYQKGNDIHAVTASEVFEVELDAVTKDQRRTAKAVNFGIAYGQGPYGLAEALGISRGEAKEIIDRYFSRFSGIKTYMQDIVRIAREQGYVETLSGRRRYLPELNTSNKMQQAFGERAAINAPMQGTAADIVKLAMIAVEKEIDAPMILQVHDELIFECESSKTKELIPQIIQVMENVFKLDVPLVVNCQSGKNWLEAH